MLWYFRQEKERDRQYYKQRLEKWEKQQSSAEVRNIFNDVHYCKVINIIVSVVEVRNVQRSDCLDLGLHGQSVRSAAQNFNRTTRRPSLVSEFVMRTAPSITIYSNDVNNTNGLVNPDGFSLPLARRTLFALILQLQRSIEC